MTNGPYSFQLEIPPTALLSRQGEGGEMGWLSATNLRFNRNSLTVSQLKRTQGYELRVLSIDPGINGAAAVVAGKPDNFKVEAVHDLPTISEKNTSGKTRRRIDPVALHELVEGIGKVDQVVCERLVAPPGISGMAAYSMGATAATISTVLALADQPMRLVSPGVWKRGLEAPADKEAARQLASRLFKSDEFWKLKKDHNRAEAALIGLWGLISG